MVPHLVSGHNPNAQPFARPAQAGEAGLILGVQLAPCAGKLLDVNIHSEVVLEDLLERSRRPHMTRQKRHIVQIGIIRDSAAIAHALRSQAKQIEQAR